MNLNLIAALALSAALIGCGALPSERQITVNTPFDSKEAAFMLRPGNNAITGSALVRQQGGGAVNCAGSRVTLLPATAFAIQRITAIYGSRNYTNERVAFTQSPPDGYVENTRNTICNAAGFFTFDKVADGEYFVQSNVTWTVGHRAQGGALMQRVKVAGGQVKEVTLAP